MTLIYVIDILIWSTSIFGHDITQKIEIHLKDSPNLRSWHVGCDLDDIGDVHIAAWLGWQFLVVYWLLSWMS